MKDKLLEMLLKATEELRLAQEEEERTEEAMDSMERRYWEGYTEATSYIIRLIIEEGKK